MPMAFRRREEFGFDCRDAAESNRRYCGGMLPTGDHYEVQSTVAGGSHLSSGRPRAALWHVIGFYATSFLDLFAWDLLT